MSLHMSTFGMRLKNIAQVALFTELVRKKLLTSLQENSIIDNIANKQSFFLQMLKFPKYDKKTKKHVCVKKAMHSKDETIFDFIICSPNDESKIAKSPLLVVPELEVKWCNDTNGKMTQVEFDFVK